VRPYFRLETWVTYVKHLYSHAFRYNGSEAIGYCQVTGASQGVERPPQCRGGWTTHVHYVYPTPNRTTLNSIGPGHIHETPEKATR